VRTWLAIVLAAAAAGTFRPNDALSDAMIAGPDGPRGARRRDDVQRADVQRRRRYVQRRSLRHHRVAGSDDGP
jgi:hypothetical protein